MPLFLIYSFYCRETNKPYSGLSWKRSLLWTYTLPTYYGGFDSGIFVVYLLDVTTISPNFRWFQSVLAVGPLRLAKKFIESLSRDSVRIVATDHTPSQLSG